MMMTGQEDAEDSDLLPKSGSLGWKGEKGENTASAQMTFQNQANPHPPRFSTHLSLSTGKWLIQVGSS